MNGNFFFNGGAPNTIYVAENAFSNLYSAKITSNCRTLPQILRCKDFISERAKSTQILRRKVLITQRMRYITNQNTCALSSPYMPNRLRREPIFHKIIKKTPNVRL